MGEYHVHVGFGFHVNCYHSYRGDTCDKLGFGSDIRIIRHIIDTLDRCNQKGIPVKGTWDFENAYSLELILPQYAPDIIESVRRRQNLCGDENILMGYNNGAMSAMTEDEFMASIKRAVSNDKGSGLKDIFGACEMIIRPQEVMFTPSQVPLYQKAGIKAICLYYSCVPFDAFRSLIPPLSDEEAFNPLTYRYEDSKMTVLPIYSPADIFDAGSLKSLVQELHEKQLKQEINRDVFLFINIDADSFLWEYFPVPQIMRNIPGFMGLEGYILEIADLEYVVFDTPGGYLQSHNPVAEISFGEDVADGNFSGYSSWAEKPFNRLIWTRLERARLYATLYEKDIISPSFEERIRLLSTTHFGLAAPVLNVTREKRAYELSEKMINLEELELQRRWEQKKHNVKEHEIWIKNTNDSSMLYTQIKIKKGFCQDITTLQCKGKGLLKYTAVVTHYWKNGDVKGIFLICQFEKIKKKYKIRFHIGSPKKQEKQIVNTLEDACGTTLLCDLLSGFPSFFSKEGNFIAETKCWIRYKGKKYRFSKPEIRQLPIAGCGIGIVLSGEIHLPREVEPGTYEYQYFVFDGKPGIYQLARVQYPYTREYHEISSEACNLGRFSDNNWEETAPMELIFPKDRKNVTSEKRYCVSKRNFAGDITNYYLEDFEQAYMENCEIDSLNHQLTGGILALTREPEKEMRFPGMLLSHARWFCGSMAHCPMRLRKTTVSMNPFGTYFGRQRYYTSRGNGSVMKIFQATMPQARSLAPAYNGIQEITLQRISDGRELSEQNLNDICAFADGCIIYATNGAVKRYRGDNVKLHKIRYKLTDEKKLHAVRSLGKAEWRLMGDGISLLKNIYNACKRSRGLQ